MHILQGSEMKHMKPEMKITPLINTAFFKNGDIVSFAPHLHPGRQAEEQREETK